MIHTLLEQQREQELGAVERREGDRKEFDYLQLLAPFDGWKMPTQAQFQPVRCHDLSPTGFSFYTAKAQTTPYVVIALGAVPFAFFIAKIVRQTETTDDDKTSVLVGCRFERRIE